MRFDDYDDDDDTISGGRHGARYEQTLNNYQEMYADNDKTKVGK